MTSRRTEARARRDLSRRGPGIDIAVRVPHAGWRRHLEAPARIARGAARAALTGARAAAGGLLPGIDLAGRRMELCVMLADDAMVRQLNREHRGLDRPTNVLSFPGIPRLARIAPDMPLTLGDIVLAHETVVAEAAAQDKPVPHHVAHLVVHGVLHLLGYDHEKAGEAEAMEELEIAILARLGIGNPYEMRRDDSAQSDRPTGE